MLAEFLADRGDWTHVMPGARACLFSLEEGPHPLPLQLDTLHFETLFCLGGSVTLTRRDGTFLTADARKVLILTDLLWADQCPGGLISGWRPGGGRRPGRPREFGNHM